MIFPYPCVFVCVFDAHARTTNTHHDYGFDSVIWHGVRPLNGLCGYVYTVWLLGCLLSFFLRWRRTSHMDNSHAQESCRSFTVHSAHDKLWTYLWAAYVCGTYNHRRYIPCNRYYNNSWCACANTWYVQRSMSNVQVGRQLHRSICVPYALTPYITYDWNEREQGWNKCEHISHIHPCTCNGSCHVDNVEPSSFERL